MIQRYLSTEFSILYLNHYATATATATTTPEPDDLQPQGLCKVDKSRRKLSVNATRYLQFEREQKKKQQKEEQEQKQLEQKQQQQQHHNTKSPHRGKQTTKRLEILAMGGGVQTTACLIKYHDMYDAILFCDTGDEQSETYSYIEQYLKPFAHTCGIPWHTLKNPRWDSLMDRCFEQKVLPMRTRRWCTVDFKIKLINRKLKQMGATRCIPANLHLGISADESSRLGATAWIDKPKYKHQTYPLIDDHITRSQCYDIIKNHGWPLPVKSGCDFCPFQSRSKFRRLARIHPERYAKIVKMEQNRRTKEPLNHGRELPMLHTLGEYDDALKEWEEQGEAGISEEQMVCDSGHCFV